MSKLIFPATLIATAGILGAIFPPAGWAFGFFVLGGGIAASGK